MSNVIAPTVQFSPEFLAFAKAAIALSEAQSGIAPSADVPVKPVVKAEPTTTRQAVATVKADKIATDAPYGYKADGTPRKKPVPTWLHNGNKGKVADAPVKADVKPRVKADKPVKADAPKWHADAAVQGSDQHIRILAAELVIYGVKSKKLTKYIVAKFATKGQASAHYNSKDIKGKLNGADIRNGSANWKLAAAIIERLPVN